MASYTPMIQQYLKIKAEYEDCLLFFRLGDFYELFFEDAKQAARELEITLTGRGHKKEERIPMCGVPYHSAEPYIAKLVEKGHKIAICEQMEDPALAKGVVRREVVQVITPGTVMNDHMLEEKRNNFLIAICKQHSTYGLAAVDVSTGEFRYTTLANKQAMVDEVTAYEPAEMLLEPELRELEELFSTSVTVMAHEPPSLQKIRSLLQAQFKHIEPSLLADQLGLKTIGHLLQYVKHTQKRTLNHLQEVTVYEAHQSMILDANARRNLELTETIRDKKRHGSLLWLLDHTVTAMGGRLLKKWLDKPLLNKQKINERLLAIETLVHDMLLTEDIREILRDVYDLERLAARVAHGTANARDLIALKRSLFALPALKRVLRDKNVPFFQLRDCPDLCQDIGEWIAETIVEDPPMSIKEGGLIQRGYNDELDKLLNAKHEGKAWLARLEEEERRKTGIKSLKVGYNRVFGYYLEVSKANLHLLPEGRYERKQTLTNAERFITPELKEKEALILEAEERSVGLEYELFIELREKISGQVKRLQTLAHWIAEIDAWQSLATVSARHGYVRPDISDDWSLHIVNGRHPVVEQMLNGMTFTPNDTTMTPEKEQIAIITGPNMAGKSTYMRQVALIVIMAHMGCFVPAEKAQIPLVDRIFTRIGAADDLTGGQSTFMVEMLETQQALTQASSRSLILLDEIGRGTSTYDGIAIAHAIIEYIYEHVGAKTLFSTHYHELTELADELERVINIHARCEERDGELFFLHRIERGRADRSYGVHVAELAGMPGTVIKRAQEVLKELEKKHETAVADESQQLSFFPMEIDPSSEQDPHGEIKQELYDAVKGWDLYNRTPLETVHFLEKMQKKLS